MRPRFSDDRVGYFEIGHLYFNDEQQKAEERAFINRWRLEPKPEDVERYKKGELVEPQKPIELWIDPATPPVWIPYIKKGIVEWQEAFEAAGFKNAIVAREVTPDDREFDIDDVRYSVVTYAASEMANAMGPFGDRPPERRDHRGRHHLVAQRDELSSTPGSASRPAPWTPQRAATRCRRR